MKRVVILLPSLNFGGAQKVFIEIASQFSQQGIDIVLLVSGKESDLGKLASEKIPRLGIATTYRHIRKLTEEEQVVGVDYPGQPPRYEWADGKDKVHFSCRSCDKLFALEDTSEDTPPAKAPKGFKVQGFEVMLYGMCPECG